MKIHTSKFVRLLKRTRTSLLTLAAELGISDTALIRMLKRRAAFDYAQSKRILEIFGADEMLSVIDWEGMNVRCPV